MKSRKGAGPAKDHTAANAVPTKCLALPLALRTQLNLVLKNLQPDGENRLGRYTKRSVRVKKEVQTWDTGGLERRGHGPLQASLKMYRWFWSWA